MKSISVFIVGPDGRDGKNCTERNDKIVILIARAKRWSRFNLK